MLPVLMFPQFDPVVVQVGPLAIRWYALAYITALVLGWRLVRRWVGWSPRVASLQQTDDFLTWATLGVVLGGRLGYVLFYQPGYFLAHPLQVFAVWTGGMSFHGGMLGVTVAIILFCRQQNMPVLGFADRIAIAAPMGLGLGRVASQLYEALMEGVILFSVMLLCSRVETIRARFGTLTGIFLVGYALARITGEFFREPDAFLGFLFAGATMGQLLSLPMLAAGIAMIVLAKPRLAVA
jgi:phosphatidylglycerol:prolipoprotein diacylglycerol transferase